MDDNFSFNYFRFIFLLNKILRDMEIKNAEKGTSIISL